MPLENNEYQIVTAQMVDDLLYIPKVCTNMCMDFLRSEWSRQKIYVGRIALDVFTGGQILGLIGISPTGLGLYKVPLRGVSQYCSEGNYPSVQFMKAQLKNNWIPEMLCQAADYTGPPRPDYQSVSSPPWFTGEDALGLRNNRSHT